MHNVCMWCDVCKVYLLGLFGLLHYYCLLGLSMMFPNGYRNWTKLLILLYIFTHTPTQGSPHPPLHLHAICRYFFIFIVSCMIKSCNSIGRPGWALKKPLMQDIGAYCIYYLGRFNCIVQFRFTFVNP